MCSVLSSVLFHICVLRDSDDYYDDDDNNGTEAKTTTTTASALPLKIHKYESRIGIETERHIQCKCETEC